MIFDKNKGSMRSLGLKFAVGLVIVVFALSGCTKASQKAGDLWDSVRGKDKEEQKEIDDEIKLEDPVIIPEVVYPRGIIKQELKYSIISGKEGKLKVTEVIVLSGDDIKIELSRKVYQKLPGEHISVFKFTIPKDLPEGEYDLLTTIMFEKESGNTSGSFRLKR